MKRIFIAVLLLSSFLKAQTNSLLNGEFWKKKPDITIVKAEVAKGNSPSQSNAASHDPVTMAINNGADFETVKYLIEQPGNSIDKNTHGVRTYLHWATSKGDPQLVKYLLDKGSDVNRTDEKAVTPLAFGASAGMANPAIYEMFFKAGVNPKQKYTDGANVLLFAIGNDTDFALTEYLTKKGLSVKDTDDLGRTAFDYAARTANKKQLSAIAKKGAKPTDNALIFASQGSRFSANTPETFKYLVEEVKLNPNAKGLDGETVLHNLVKKQKQDEAIAYFIAKGVDVNTKDNNGDNVLMIAASTNNLDAVKTILAKTKDINTTNNNGETALVAAIKSGSPEIVNYLIENGAKTNIETSNGNLATYLVQAYKPARGNEKNTVFEEKLEILKNNKVNLTAKNKNGETLYHTAVIKNDLNLLKALENLNIDINAANNEGFTPLHKAALVAKNEQILKYLIEKGANKTMVTEFDETAYDLASDNELLKQNNISIEFLK